MDRKEAIEIVRMCCPKIANSECAFETAMRVLVPELKESEGEDEKIRKALISILKSDFEKDTTIYDISVGDMIAWLEKQTNGLIWHKVKSGEYVLEPTLILKKNGEYELVKDAILSLIDAEYTLPLSCVKKQGSQNLANSAKTCKDKSKFKVW